MKQFIDENYGRDIEKAELRKFKLEKEYRRSDLILRINNGEVKLSGSVEDET